MHQCLNVCDSIHNIAGLPKPECCCANVREEAENGSQETMSSARSTSADDATRRNLCCRPHACALCEASVMLSATVRTPSPMA